MCYFIVIDCDMISYKVPGGPLLGYRKPERWTVCLSVTFSCVWSIAAALLRNVAYQL